MENINSIFQLIGSIVVAGGGLSLIVYQVFKHLAAKWLDIRFDERLQALKHGQQKEIEQLKFKISALLDRTVKLHQREFDVLPEAWAKLNDAYWCIRQFVAPIQSYPDLDRMSEAQREEFIGTCRLQDWQKSELREARDKNAYYQQSIYWYRSEEATTKSRDAYAYLMKNGIFVEEELRMRLNSIHDLMWHALIEHQGNEENHIIPRQRERIGHLIGEGDDMMKAMEREIHQRLWPASGEG